MQVRLYHLLMVQWLRSSLGLTVPDPGEELATACWACSRGAEQGALKTCTECKVARYCNST